MELSSGWLKTPESVRAVRGVTHHGVPVVVSRGDYAGSYVAVKRLQGRSLRKGDIVLASYNGTNQGADLYEVLGFSNNGEKYGKSGVKYDSVKQIFETKGIKKSLKALEELDDENEYGRSHYLIVRDLKDGDEGPWFYIFEGRWSIGSGADPLSFTLMSKV